MGGAHRDPQAAIAATGDAIEEALHDLGNMGPAEIRDHRADKFLTSAASSKTASGPAGTWEPPLHGSLPRKRSPLSNEKASRRRPIFHLH